MGGREAAAEAPAVLVAGLRNADACAAIVGGLLTDGIAGRVTVVACGERWSSVEPGTDGIRPGIEDRLGAGVVRAQQRHAGFALSAEATVAAVSGDGCGATPIATCVSARN